MVCDLRLGRCCVQTLLALGMLSAPLAAQRPDPGQSPIKVKRSGPRFGVTLLTGGISDTLRSRYNVDVGNVITQFGWQYERQFGTFDGGPTAVSEWIVLVGGMEQGAFLPSLSWIVGVRTRGNFEVGVGPNLTPVGTSLVVAAGQTFQAGALNIPVNLVVVPSKIGTRISILTGFNIHK